MEEQAGGSSNALLSTPYHNAQSKSKLRAASIIASAFASRRQWPARRRRKYIIAHRDNYAIADLKYVSSRGRHHFAYSSPQQCEMSVFI